MCRQSLRTIVSAAAITAIVAGGLAFSEDPQSPDSCTLLVTLFNEPFPDESDVPLVPLTFDAHIAMRAVVEKVVTGTCGFSAKDRVIFLIHSPSRTLGGYWFHDKKLYLMLKQSDKAQTKRQWDLVGLDWPLFTETPFSENLICSGQGYSVRVLVGESNTMIGPFSVFRDDELLISLGTLEVVRAHPLRKGRSFALEYPGDVDGRSFKPAFHFRADHQAAVLTIGSETYALSCEWPDAQ